MIAIAPSSSRNRYRRCDATPLPWCATMTRRTIWCRIAWSARCRAGICGARKAICVLAVHDPAQLYINAYRARKRRGVGTTIDDAQPSIAPKQESGLQARDVLAAIDQLPEEQKSLLLLIGVEDLSYEQAARVLAIPIGTVMSRLSRARQRLRTLMEDERAPFLRRVK